MFFSFFAFFWFLFIQTVTSLFFLTQKRMYIRNLILANRLVLSILRWLPSQRPNFRTCLTLTSIAPSFTYSSLSLSLALSLSLSLILSLSLYHFSLTQSHLSLLFAGLILKITHTNTHTYCHYFTLFLWWNIFWNPLFIT